MQVFRQPEHETQQQSRNDRDWYYKSQPSPYSEVNLYALTKQELLELQARNRQQQQQQQQQQNHPQQRLQHQYQQQQQQQTTRRSRSIESTHSREPIGRRRARSSEQPRLNPAIHVPAQHQTQQMQLELPPPSNLNAIPGGQNEQGEDTSWLQHQQLRLLQFQLQHEERQEYRKAKQIKAHSSPFMRRSSMSTASTKSMASLRNRSSSSGRSKSSHRNRKSIPLPNEELRRAQSMVQQKDTQKGDGSPRRASSVGPGEALLLPRRPSLDMSDNHNMDYEEELVTVRHSRRKFSSRIRGSRHVSQSPSRHSRRGRCSSEDTKGLLGPCAHDNDENEDDDEQRLGEDIQSFWSTKRWFGNSRSSSVSRSSSSTPRSLTPFTRRQTVPLSVQSDDHFVQSHGALDFTQMILNSEPLLTRPPSPPPMSPRLIAEPSVMAAKLDKRLSDLLLPLTDRDVATEQRSRSTNIPILRPHIRERPTRHHHHQQNLPDPPGLVQTDGRFRPVNLKRAKSKSKSPGPVPLKDQEKHGESLSSFEQIIERDVLGSTTRQPIKPLRPPSNVIHHHLSPPPYLPQDEAPKRQHKKHKTSKSKSKSQGSIEVTSNVLSQSTEDQLDGSDAFTSQQSGTIDFEASMQLYDVLEPPRREHKTKRAKSKSKSLGPLEASASQLHLSKKQIKKEIKSGRLCIQLTTSGTTLVCLTEEPQTMPDFGYYRYKKETKQEEGNDENRI